MLSGTGKECTHFLCIVIGSITEHDTHMIIYKDMSFINENDFSEIIKQLDNIGKMLSGLIKYRKSKQ
jgi:four helix bundle protein